MITIKAAVVAALLGASGLVPAGPTPPTPVHFDLAAGRTPPKLVHFDLSAGQTPENVVLDRDGSVDVTFAAARQVARVGADGRTRILATLPPPADPAAVTPLLGFPLTTGLVRVDRTFHVLYATGGAETGVWTFAEGRAPRKLAALPAGGLPNGLARDDRTGTLYVTDSAKGAVYAVSPKGHVSLFSDSAVLTSTGFLGVNGARIRDRHLYVSNLDRGTLLRSPLTGRGAGVFETVASGLTGIDDFAFTGRGEEFVAALITENKVVLADRRGARKTLLSEADGLSNPTSVAIRGRTIYVPSAAYTTQRDPNLLIGGYAESGLRPQENRWAGWPGAGEGGGDPNR